MEMALSCLEVVTDDSQSTAIPMSAGILIMSSQLHKAPNQTIPPSWTNGGIHELHKTEQQSWEHAEK